MFSRPGFRLVHRVTTKAPSVETRRSYRVTQQLRFSLSTCNMSSVTTHPSLTKVSTERTAAPEPYCIVKAIFFDLMVCRCASRDWAVQPGRREPSACLRVGLPRLRSKDRHVCRRRRRGAGAPGTAKPEKCRRG